MTGKAKQDFEAWYLKYSPTPYNGCNACVITDLEAYYSLGDSMQFGVIQDWFDSVDLMIDIQELHGGWSMRLYSNNGYGDKDSDEYLGLARELKSRHEARTEAVKQAIEIYNNEQ